jgi:hypothetical protein
MYIYALLIGIELREPRKWTSCPFPLEYYRHNRRLTLSAKRLISNQLLQDGIT